MRLFRAAMSCSSGGGGTQEAEGTVVVESLAERSNARKRTVARSIGRVGTIFGEGGGLLDHRRARKKVLNPCVRAPMSCPPGGGGTQEAEGTIVERLAGRSNARNRTVTQSIG